jgi:hypothetical protein
MVDVLHIITLDVVTLIYQYKVHGSYTKMLTVFYFFVICIYSFFQHKSHL